MRTVLVLFAVCSLAVEPTAQRPNVVLVMADDQGIGDFSHAGHGQLETPHLDRMAAASPRFERFYVSPVCSPTRASLMTGRYNYRTRVVDTWIGRSMMDPDEVTVAEILRDAGYATGIFGKWHLGDEYPLRAMDQGFDEALVHKGGGLAQPSEPLENARRYTDPILFHNGEPVATEGYCTDVYFDAAFEFMDRSVEQERPFFAYVATNAPHGPFHDVPPKLLEKYRAKPMADALRGKSDKVEREAAICAMVENIDQNMGRLFAHLEARGLTENTLVVFLNDNGPVWGRYTRGLRGFKTGVYEGGIRAPLFLHWPGRLSPEQHVETIAAHIDLLPTIAELIDVTLPEGLALDGRSLVPLLEGRSEGWPERMLFLQTHRGNAPTAEHHFAVVGQRWKLVRASGFGRAAPPEDHPFELFDVAADPTESRDLAAEKPEVVAAMRGSYRRWFADVSTTRADNFDPPRIVVGHASAPTVTLTRQDLRADEGEGWNNAGAWWLEAAQRVEVEVELIWNDPHADARAVVITLEGAGDPVAVRREVLPDEQRTPLGTIGLPAGRFQLRVRPEEGPAVYQVVLRAGQ